MKFVQILLGIIIISSSIYAQDRLFLFTFTPQNNTIKSTFIRYETAYGQGTFEPIGIDDFEQNIGFQSRIGKYFSLLDQSGLAFTNGVTKLSQQTELLANLLNTNDNDVVDFSAGMGFLHEYGGTNVLISRVMIGRQFASWAMYSNLVFEHAFSPDRDPVDLMTTVGFSYNLFNWLRTGVEAVGQDLEGFWDPDEAEGGATVYAGPSFNLTIPGTPLNITIGGGEIIRATYSMRSSGALRPLPIVKGNGFIIRNVISYGF
jgi:hypothetical protein